MLLGIVEAEFRTGFVDLFEGAEQEGGEGCVLADPFIRFDGFECTQEVVGVGGHVGLSRVFEPSADLFEQVSVVRFGELVALVGGEHGEADGVGCQAGEQFVDLVARASHAGGLVPQEAEEQEVRVEEFVDAEVQVNAEDVEQVFDLRELEWPVALLDGPHGRSRPLVSAFAHSHGEVGLAGVAAQFDEVAAYLLIATRFAHIPSLDATTEEHIGKLAIIRLAFLNIVMYCQKLNNKHIKNLNMRCARR